MWGPGRADTVNAGSRETRYSECRDLGTAPKKGEGYAEYKGQVAARIKTVEKEEAKLVKLSMELKKMRSSYDRVWSSKRQAMKPGLE
ncbi:unnamed protein product, partial [Staurois parvus]